MGLAFLVIGALSLWKGAKMFVPDRKSKREDEMASKRASVSLDVCVCVKKMKNKK
jgi:hypothetical protein